MTTVPTTNCSFCGKSEDQISQMVAGPGVYICNECVALCEEIFANGTRADEPTELPYWEAMDDEQLLAQLPRIAATATQVEENLRVWVQRVRQRGVTWTRIGQSLGMTRQSAWERFSGEE